MASPTVRTEPLWRWLGLTVGGTVLPFGILALAYWLVAGRAPTLVAALGLGALLIPSSMMNVETMWIFHNLHGPGRAVWHPAVLIGCGLAALGGTVCFGITAALDTAPPDRVRIAPEILAHLSRTVAFISLGEFLMALVIGTFGVLVSILVREQEAPKHE